MKKWTFPWKLKSAREFFRQISPVKKMKISTRGKHKFNREKNLNFSWNLRRKHTYYEIRDDHLSKLKHRWFYRNPDFRIKNKPSVFNLVIIHHKFTESRKSPIFCLQKLLGRSVDIYMRWVKIIPAPPPPKIGPLWSFFLVSVLGAFWLSDESQSMVGVFCLLRGPWVSSLFFVFIMVNVQD